MLDFRSLSLLLTLLFALNITTAQAQMTREYRESNIVGFAFQPRSMALGNAVVTGADGRTSLFVNPAAVPGAGRVEMDMSMMLDLDGPLGDRQSNSAMGIAARFDSMQFHFGFYEELFTFEDQDLAEANDSEWTRPQKSKGVLGLSMDVPGAFNLDPQAWQFRLGYSVTVFEMINDLEYSRCDFDGDLGVLLRRRPGVRLAGRPTERGRDSQPMV